MDARLERLKAIIEQTVAKRDELIEDRDRLIEEIKSVMKERDEALKEAKLQEGWGQSLLASCDEYRARNARLFAERDEARRWAEILRDKYETGGMSSPHGQKRVFPWERAHVDG